jgi:hypothetical protein
VARHKNAAVRHIGNLEFNQLHVFELSTPKGATRAAVPCFYLSRPFGDSSR